MTSDRRHFENVAICTDGDNWGNIHRIDAKQATIWIGPHAQYKNAVFIKFVRVGKRKAEFIVREGDPYVVVMRLDSNVKPDDLYLESRWSRGH